MMMTTRSGCTCLHIATECQHGSLPDRLAIFDALIEVGGNDLLFSVCDQGRSCLFMSAEMGNAAMTTRLVELAGDDRRDLMLLADNYGVSCLLAACGNGHLATVQYLLNTGHLPRCKLVMARPAFSCVSKTDSTNCRHCFGNTSSTAAARWAREGRRERVRERSRGFEQLWSLRRKTYERWPGGREEEGAGDCKGQGSGAGAGAREAACAARNFVDRLKLGEGPEGVHEQRAL